MIKNISYIYLHYILNFPKYVIMLLMIILIGVSSNISNFKLDASADSLILENDMDLLSPEFEQISWDGKEEKVEVSMPPANGPALDLSTVMVPINTRSGCYNSRGRVNRCVHYLQTDFHEKMFRRGSSFKWSDMLNFL